MNILHISPYYPSLETNHAGGVCMGKEIESLEKNNKVYILTFVASAYDRKLAALEGKEHYKYVVINKWSRIIHILLEPFLPAYFAARTSYRYAFKLIYCMRKYNIEAVHAEYSSMGQYIWLIKKIFPYVRIHLVEHDVTAQSYERKKESSKGFRRWYYEWEYKKISKQEKYYCRKADRVLTFNEKDCRLLKNIYKLENVQVINPYYGIDDIYADSLEKKRKAEYANVCFLGQMGREENHLAAQRLIRIGYKIKEMIPELNIYIIGNQPLEELKEEQNEFIHITGFVEDVDEYLQRAQIAVFPLILGAGIKIKVLRSLALGIPVITGKVGAEGIDESGEVISLAETDEEYISNILELIKDEKRCLELSCLSQEYVKRNFDWGKSEEVLRRLYERE
ncbi:glycosyltransferase family 4 protein [Lacrimispora sp.]|jgi:glycosyltransferase involved in cell wall biosynthesis|uniref:glycosyltransferase family 4 protein n=1 Tax=Lacrimispora sp. TaxID=2719234 RepID=UPI0028A8A8C3|nr:glycosyltransferase family 4 protein [Lacrimispora sp.]